MDSAITIQMWLRIIKDEEFSVSTVTIITKLKLKSEQPRRDGADSGKVSKFSPVLVVERILFRKQLALRLSNIAASRGWLTLKTMILPNLKSTSSHLE